MLVKHILSIASIISALAGTATSARVSRQDALGLRRRTAHEKRNGLVLHKRSTWDAPDGVISPKVFIVSMFEPEMEPWIEPFGLYAQNITVPGLSPLFPNVHCDAAGEICQYTTGESEINAASSTTALLHSPYFNLTSTFFLIAGIAGANPHIATTGSVTFAKFAVQVALEYEFVTRELPSNYSTGYIPLGADAPDQYPGHIYGSEVFELDDNLRQRAMYLANLTTLADTATTQKYRALYDYAPANQPPAVVGCDVVTSDAYWSGELLAESFGNYTSLISNGSAVYCSTAQEDNATLEAMVRAAATGLMDFSRIIVMRTVSDFDRPPKGEAAFTNLLFASQGGFTPAIDNILIAGGMIVKDMLMYWDDTYAPGIKPGNYIGDIFGTLGGIPDFGPGP
ncbi:NUP-domain-containing protein [Saitoella complicata NRRL Y-17804]|uniref:Purine nucleoside permease n=1 Tax=Saitoella complicata (strain BCRC 22490 / CBS 7301 / JCM 7358 / NBRC 10748 / NRRL Y-17804) TaxID=698492 RepID=A0A0E9NLL6_SAICN|nr:NUP-domain-containing protein [Saitoella complicata NRRL Y-17804]ODQ55488.1 NUP-domain-containing protein [Saitoella complicata NRRL Y-17804]GAO50739.1 hypothetical protein G7K_4860-t1 [Saitoella complicata NRRL Y-17804]